MDELRRGELSEENWRYLHGKPVEGCRLTAAERESRRRVIAGPGDPRLGEEKFRWAAAIVANNDAKYQINKDRAEDYSRAAESPLRWSVALDAPSAEVLQTQARGGAGEKGQGARGASLRAQECDKAARIRWLQYHDRDTENLSGMLPLAVGMRVVLADHLDRAEDKLLLRGSAGRVHSWVWKENDLRPTCVYVKFDGATCQLDGARSPASTRSTPPARSGSWMPSARSRSSRSRGRSCRWLRPTRSRPTAARARRSPRRWWTSTSTGGLTRPSGPWLQAGSAPGRTS